MKINNNNFPEFMDDDGIFQTKQCAFNYPVQHVAYTMYVWQTIH